MEFDRSSNGSNDRRSVEHMHHQPLVYANSGGTTTTVRTSDLSGRYQILAHPHPVENKMQQPTWVVGSLAAGPASPGDVPRNVVPEELVPGNTNNSFVYLNCYNPELLAGDGQSE